MDFDKIISISLSGAAFALSVVATSVSLVQKRSENRRTQRQQLTDTVAKMSGCFEQVERLRHDHKEDWNTPQVVNLRTFYNAQKLLYARQATYIVENFPEIATEVDYNTIARAFADNDDDVEACFYYEKAINISEGKSLYQAINLRGYGRILYRLSRDNEGREAFERAIRIVDNDTDSAFWFQAESYQRWASIEVATGKIDSARGHLNNAEERYQKIRFPPRRIEGLKNLKITRDRFESEAVEALNGARGK